MNALPKVKFSTAIKNGFINYINLSGRIRRSEYWFFLLLINGITFILSLLLTLYITGVIGYYEYDDYYYYYEYFVYDHDAILALTIVLPIYVAGIILPTLSATVRRLHDVGRRGEYIFIGLVPFFGGIALLVLLCQDSMKEGNEFGPSPKYNNNINNSPLMQTPAQSLENQLLPKDNIIMQNNDNAYPNNNIIYNSNNSQPIPMDVLNNNSINNND